MLGLLRLALCLLVLAPSVGLSQDLAEPDCQALKTWTASVEVPKVRDTQSAARSKAQAQALFTDARTASVFSKPISAWSDRDSQLVAFKMNACYNNLRVSDAQAANRIAYTASELQKRPSNALLEAVTPPAGSSFSAPACPALESWVQSIPARVPASARAGGDKVREWTEESDRRFDVIFGDAATTNTFGKPFADWSDVELKAARFAIENCQRDAQEAKRADEATRLMIASAHLNTRMRGRSTSNAANEVAISRGGGPSAGECAPLVQWVSSVPTQTFTRAGEKYATTVRDPAIMEQFRQKLTSDAATAAAFRVALSAWTEGDRRVNVRQIERCMYDARTRKDVEFAARIEFARSAVLNAWAAKLRGQ